MIHRHIIEGETLSLTAIDDIVDRRSLADWRELKARACVDSSILDFGDRETRNVEAILPTRLRIDPYRFENRV